MIAYVTRAALNIEKYNNCISNAINSRIYAYSWYLDIVADENWDVLVLDDYVAVMPLPKRRKYFIDYVYPPFWILQLGIFYTTNEFSELDFINKLYRTFKFIELRMNTENFSGIKSKNFIKKQYHSLDLNIKYESLKSNYRSDRFKDLKKAVKNDLREIWNDEPKKLIHLFKCNVGARIPNIISKDYERLESLMNYCIDTKIGEILSIYDKQGEITASAFFLKHQKSITILCSSTDFKNRNNGGNTFLINSAIEKYQSNFSIFNFGGSSMPTIAAYFKSFGAYENNYFLLKKRSKFF